MKHLLHYAIALAASGVLVGGATLLLFYAGWGTDGRR